MKKTILIIAALCSSMSFVRAEEAESSYSVTVDFTYASRYVFRGQQLADGTLMPSVEFSTGNFTAGIWSAQPLIDNVDNEVDFYVSYGVPVGDWALDFGITAYYYPELDITAGGDDVTYEPYVGLSGAVGGIDTGAYLFYDTTLEILTIEGSIGYSVPMESSGTSLDFSASIGSIRPDVGSDVTYYNLGMSIPFALSDTGALTVGLNYGHNNIAGGDGYGENAHFFGTIGVSIGF